MGSGALEIFELIKCDLWERRTNQEVTYEAGPGQELRVTSASRLLAEKLGSD